MGIGKAYQYMYYRLYKHFSKGVVWMTEWKASLAMDVLEAWLFFSLLNYYSLYTNYHGEVSIKMPIIWIPFLGILLTNYLIFHHQNRWEDIIHEFDKMDSKKNKIGGWIALGIILFLLANLVFSFYLLGRNSH